MVDPLRIAIVDNFPIFREGLVQILRRQKCFAVVAEGATAQEAEEFAHTRRIDLLLMEAAVQDSLRAAQNILQAHQDIKVMFLASIEDGEHATEALRAGAQGYILKGITGSDLVQAVKAVHAGEHYISSDLAWRLVTKPAPALSLGADHGKPLSLREQQVLDHTSKGLTNQEIASVLGLAVSTIKYYKTLAFRKMGFRNRLEAMFAVSKMPEGS